MLPSADRNGKTVASRRKRREKPSTCASLASSSGQLDALQIPEWRDLVGKVGRRQIGGFPQFAQRLRSRHVG